MQHKKQAYELLNPYLEADGGIEGCAGLDCFLEDRDYEGWLENLTMLLKKPDPDFAPLEVFFLMGRERIVGVVSIFHTLPPAPLDAVGHLGYSIHPQARRKGKGTALLNLALEYCYKLGIKRVMVTPGEDNIASRKLVEKCGGVYERSLRFADNGPSYTVYWFSQPEFVGTDDGGAQG